MNWKPAVRTEHEGHDCLPHLGVDCSQPQRIRTRADLYNLGYWSPLTANPKPTLTLYMAAL